MTQSLQRTILLALATTALTAASTAAPAAPLRPKYPIRLAEAAPEAQPAASAADAAQPASAHVRRHKAASRKATHGKAVAADDDAASDAPATYTVKSGDTLDKIAKKLGTSVVALKHANRLKSGAIKPGQVLKVGEAPAAKGSSAKTAKAKPAAPTSYKVRKGDTLYSIARRFNATPDSLLDENHLKSASSLRAGQTLRLPNGSKDESSAAEAEPETPAPAARRGRGRGVAEAAEAPSTGDTRTTGRSVTGRVVEVEGKATRYTVKKGETLEKIAKKLDTTVADLKEDNRLRKSAVRPGQVLKGPINSAKAYVAGSGDTLAEIGKRFGVSAEALRAENGLSRHAAIRPGQKIRLPDGYRDHGAIVTRSRVAAPDVEPERPEPERTPPARPAPAARRPEPTPVLPSSPRPYTPSQPSRTYAPPPSTSGGYSGPGVASAPSVSDAQISELGRGRFVWPLQGQIVSDFGPKGQGQRNDGVNIAAHAGEPIHAAADGDVVYAGDQVPGFGNLVLIKHADGWVTAYGHLSRVEVKMQQKVTQGQEIGQAGATGGVSEPQLHFEVRYAPSPLERARPIDPKLVLPK